MPRVRLDWDPRYKKAAIVSDFLESIRGGFSIPNDNKKMLEKQGKAAWLIPDFFSPITKTGRFEIGLI